jgi:hypothetical protein
MHEINRQGIAYAIAGTSHCECGRTHIDMRIQTKAHVLAAKPLRRSRASVKQGQVNLGSGFFQQTLAEDTLRHRVQINWKLFGCLQLNMKEDRGELFKGYLASRDTCHRRRNRGALLPTPGSLTTKPGRPHLLLISTRDAVW